LPKDCPQVETFAACAWSISVEKVLDPVLRALRRSNQRQQQFSYDGETAPVECRSLTAPTTAEGELAQQES